jgi:diaminopimelate epimerase
MTSCNFFKYQGGGNDFILIEGFSCEWSPDQVQALCHRQYGIGADGLLLLSPTSSNRYDLAIYNCDGSFAAMCGNGLRCVGQYLIDQGKPKQHYQIAIAGQEIALSYRNGHPVVAMELQQMLWELPLAFDDVSLDLHLIEVGVPHLIHFTSQLDSVDVASLGRALRHHPSLQPSGANVTFVEPPTKEGLRIRTYERGVEAETLACGTGAAAAALASSRRFGTISPITVHFRSKQTVAIHFKREGDRFSQVELCGHAARVFEGRIRIS